ncbi:hypothetical protein COLO4_21035 [Corchorus olitorius]|uniref:Uncharacterized protein n=1 Tax=Corchorus olitorius TaxID=93759 RepID=A0A1R3IVN5_9ROSI|nr:hypothetical protein COLO4_21035 [Corchorus olitorius]
MYPRPTGFSSPDSAPPSYNRVPPPLDGIEIEKQRAQEIVARLTLSASSAGAETKRPRVENGSGGGFDDEKGFNSAPSGMPYLYLTLFLSFFKPTCDTCSLIRLFKLIFESRVSNLYDLCKAYLRLCFLSYAHMKIQRDMDADSDSVTRPVELMGTTAQIVKAEQLINDVLAEVLYDAFFKYQTESKLTTHGHLYHEGKDFELLVCRRCYTTMLINMQRYGHPPSSTFENISGLNAPIPSGAGFGYHFGGWDKPPVDEERKGGWRYVDTGQVLIESACSVDRVEEALSKLLPILPKIQYFRFNPVYFQLIEADVLPAPFMKLPLTYGHVFFLFYAGIFRELQLPFSCLWA